MTRETKLGMVVAGSFLALLGGVVGTKYFFKPAAPAQPAQDVAQSQAPPADDVAQAPPAKPQQPADNQTQPPKVVQDKRLTLVAPPSDLIPVGSTSIEPVTVEAPIIAPSNNNPLDAIAVISPLVEVAAKTMKPDVPGWKTDLSLPAPVVTAHSEEAIKNAVQPPARNADISQMIIPPLEVVKSPAKKDSFTSNPKKNETQEPTIVAPKLVQPPLDKIEAPPLDVVVEPGKGANEVDSKNKDATAGKQEAKRDARSRIGEAAIPPVPSPDVLITPPAPELTTVVEPKTADPMQKKEQPAVIVPADVTPKKEQAEPLPLLQAPKIEMPKEIPAVKDSQPPQKDNPNKTRPVVLDIDGGAPKAPSALDPAIAAPKTESPKQENNYDEDLHSLKKTDTYASISKQYYNSEAYAVALQRYNRDNSGRGDYVRVPPIWVLEKKYASDIAGGSAASTSARPVSYAPPATAETPRTADAFYTVGDNGESLASIAKKVLGSEDAWQRLYQLNPQINPAQTLPGGTRLKLPDGVK